MQLYGSLARRAGFAVLLDFSQHEQQRLEIFQKFALDGKIPDVFQIQVLMIAQVSGKQTPARGELSAIAELVEGFSGTELPDVCLEIHTDASYVTKAKQKIVNQDRAKSYL